MATIWKDGFEGKAKQLYSRSGISKDVEELQNKFGVEVVGIVISPEDGFTVEFIVADKEISS